PGQKVAAIAPKDARLVIEANLPNRDVAFIQRDLPAELKFDAFPFQDYGTIPGSVLAVAPDAQSDPQTGSFYKITILPRRPTIHAQGREVPLRSGLTVTAEIVRERKSVLDIFLEPFRQLRGK